MAIGTVLVMLSARPARVRETIRNDGRVERAKLVDDLNTMIMEEVERHRVPAPRRISAAASARSAWARGSCCSPTGHCTCRITLWV